MAGAVAVLAESVRKVGCFAISAQVAGFKTVTGEMGRTY